MMDFEVIVSSEHLTAGEKNAVLEAMAAEFLSAPRALFIERTVKRLLEKPVHGAAPERREREADKASPKSRTRPTAR
jgi:hypothetical protein